MMSAFGPASLPLFLAQTAASPSSEPVFATFAQYGIIGVALLVLGRFAFAMVKREQDRADRLEAELAKQNESYREKYGPALAAAASAVSSALEFIEEIRRDEYLRSLSGSTSPRRRSPPSKKTQ